MYANPSFIKLLRILFYGYENRSRLVANRSRPEPVKTGLVTAKDCKRLVSRSSVQFFEVSRFGRTGYGYGLRYWAPKDWTRLDFQTLNAANMEGGGKGISWGPEKRDERERAMTHGPFS